MPSRRTVALVGTLLVAACGGAADVPTVEVRDAGKGSGALLVQAYVKGEATVPNAEDASAFRTRVVVRVSRRGIPVTNATVHVNDLALVHQGGGAYVEPAQLLGLPPPVVGVEVTTPGGDWAVAAVSSPGGHAFTRPSRGGETLALAPGRPLEVEWVRASRADSASLNVGGFAALGPIDEGAYAIPPGAPGLAPAAPAAVGLWRENRVMMRGATTGSLLSVSVWNGLQVTLARP